MNKLFVVCGILSCFFNVGFRMESMVKFDYLSIPTQIPLQEQSQSVHENDYSGRFTEFQRQLLEKNPPKFWAAWGALQILIQKMNQEPDNKQWVIGLGSGSTVGEFFIPLLADSIQQGALKRIKIFGVPSSEATRNIASQFGISLKNIDEFGTEQYPIHLTIDGADEVHRDSLAAIKGAGGVLTGEKLNIARSQEVILIVDQSKVVETLGKFNVALDVEEQYAEEIIKHIATLPELTGTVKIRTQKEGKSEIVFRTPGTKDRVIIDANFDPIRNQKELAEKLEKIPGVVSQALFFTKNPPDYVVVGSSVEFKISGRTSLVTLMMERLVSQMNKIIEKINHIEYEFEWQSKTKRYNDSSYLTAGDPPISSELNQLKTIKEKIIKIGKPTVPSLIVLLDRADWRIRAMVVEVLGRIGRGNKDVLLALLTLFFDCTEWGQKEETPNIVAEALTHIGVEFDDFKKIQRRILNVAQRIKEEKSRTDIREWEKEKKIKQILQTTKKDFDVDKEMVFKKISEQVLGKETRIEEAESIYQGSLLEDIKALPWPWGELKTEEITINVPYMYSTLPAIEQEKSLMLNYEDKAVYKVRIIQELRRKEKRILFDLVVPTDRDGYGYRQLSFSFSEYKEVVRIGYDKEYGTRYNPILGLKWEGFRLTIIASENFVKWFRKLGCFVYNDEFRDGNGVIPHGPFSYTTNAYWRILTPSQWNLEQQFYSNPSTESLRQNDTSLFKSL